MITSTAPVIDANGIWVPTYEQVLEFLQSKYRGIYGPDTYLEGDSQDGQLVAIFAKAISDANGGAVAVYNAFSPATAQGNGLSSVVKINGISRAKSSFSTVDQIIIGQAGTPINNGVTQDKAGNKWSLPASVVIPPEGTVTVTATCQTPGAIIAAPGTVTQIATPTRGWQSVTNASDASPGAPVERDPVLRQRQAVSTAIPSRTVLEGMVGAVANLPGVVRYRAFENDDGVPDVHGIPGHKTAFVVEGGDATAICQTIALKKTPGGGTYGTTTIVVPDAYRIPHAISIFRPTDVAIGCQIAMKALPGYNATTGAAVQKAVSDFINGVAIGGGAAGCVEWDACIAAAKSVAGGTTFKIESLTLIGPTGAGSPDVALLFNQAATCTPDAVQLNF
ncbi:baseplate J/gp47 family protein [Paraburkholderia dioscoreae]|uniref:Putative bacteriophage protein n=1 Tax=Paraburkholderia dioscoreae TaxID=2604047 RepID=A0A5Q4Z283_9BURK|nr:baseplate J/gp47 family protein [Paraburkholderia dioscoreae]VVD29150.1 putative bacteriophage protein [Paraburkholderia dioscoreae]